MPNYPSWYFLPACKVALSRAYKDLNPGESLLLASISTKISFQQYTMALPDLLRGASQTNFEGSKFISMVDAYQLITEERVKEWSTQHPLCYQHGHHCPQKDSLIRRIMQSNRILFLVLIFAELEHLTKRILARKTNDVFLFHVAAFDDLCKFAGLDAEQRERLDRGRREFGVIFAKEGYQDVPRGTVIPFRQRENSNKWGSGGQIFKVKMPDRQVQGYTEGVSHCKDIVV